MIKNIKKSELFTCLLLLILSFVQCFYFLAFNEPFFSKAAYTVSTFVFYVLLGSMSRKWLNIFIVFSFLVSCFVFPTLKIYGNIGYEYISAIFYTNASESISYLKIIDSSVYVPLLLLGIYSLYLIRKSDKISLTKPLIILLLIVLCAIPMRRFFIPYKTQFYQCFYILPIHKVLKITDFYFAVKREDSFINEQSKKQSSWKITEQPKQFTNQNIVVVIGESVRKDFLHSYGFSIENTPFIERSKPIQFNNYIAVGSHTVSSLLRTIALSNNLLDYEIENNIVTLSKKVGYKIFWLSNQGMLGEVNSPISAIALKAETHFFLTKDEYTNHQDTELLPQFYELLQKQNTPQMIVLHTNGSHPKICDRTGGVYDEFIGSDELSCYNKTIKNTDAFLEKVYEALAKTQQPFTLIYFSDHGLKITENKLLVHGDAIKQIYDVPLLVWSSKFTKAKQINAIRTGKDFLYLFSEILGVKTQNIQRNYDFLSDDKNDDNTIQVFTYIEDKNGSIINYSDLKNRPLTNINRE